MQTGMRGEITILSGPIHSGKSTGLRRLMTELRRSGRTLAGLTTEDRFGERWTVDVATGHAWLLARPRSTAPDASGPVTPRYAFADEGFAHAESVLRAAIPADVLVIDELGPLEFLRNEGWVAALKILDERQFEEAIVVIRETLLDVALARWPDARVVAPR